jgi:hypothetical protein
VGKTESDILAGQIGLIMSNEDRLRSLRVLSITFLEDEMSLEVRALITSEAGDEADISLADQLRFKRHEVVTDPFESVWRLAGELQGTDLQIMEYVFGYNNKPQLTVQAIADKLNLTLSYVIEVRNRLSLRLRDLQQ